VLHFLTHEDLVSLLQDEAKFNKNYFIKKIYREQIKEHDEVVATMNMGSNNICLMMTVAAENLLSLKQLKDPLENVEAQGCNDASAIAMLDKDSVVNGGTMKSSSQQKRTLSRSASEKVVDKKIATVVRKSLRKKNLQ